MTQLYLKRVKTPIVRQMETVDCAAAALGIILAYYGCHVPLETLRSECLVSRDGVSVANLVKAAKRFGMEATVGQQGLSPEIKVPLILFWNRKHYVVLEGIKGNKIYINDPKQGPKVLDWETFNSQFSGVTIEFHATDCKKTSKPKLWKAHLLPLVQEQWRPLVSLCFGMMVLSLLGLSPVIFTRLFIDNMVSEHALYTRDWLLLLMGLLFVLQLTVSYSSRKLFRLLETRFATTMSMRLLHRLLRLPLQFFAHRRAGDLIYRIQAADRLAGAPWSSVCSMTTAVFQGVLTFGLMFTYNPVLSVITLLVMVIYFLGTFLCQKKWGYMAGVTQARMTELTVLTASYLSTIVQMKAQCSEAVYFAKWQQLLARYLGAHRQYSHKSQLLQLIGLCVFSLGYLSIVTFSIYLISQNHMTIGEMMGYQILFLSFNEALVQGMKFGNQREHIKADLQSITDIIDYPMESTAPSSRFDRPPGLGKIQFIDVTFGYSREFKPLFSRLNLTIEAGSHVAIVGPTGSGKSTLVHLLSGLYPPWSGAILIDGIPLWDYSPSERARLLGVVSQQQFFYQGSIEDNLCLWNESYSAADMMAALRMACIDELATQTEDGLAYQLLEGASNISGGQRQRLEIARTLLAKPRILLLDEATSSLDSIIEGQIKNNIQHYPATKIVIAHRLNTIQNTDMIFILNNGQLIDYGSKQQLVSKKSAAFTELFAIAG